MKNKIMKGDGGMSWENIRLGDYVKIKTGKLDANASSENGLYPFFTCSKDPLKIDTFSYDCECVLVAGNGDLNAKYYEGKFDAYQRTYIIESIDKEKLHVKYLYYFLSEYLTYLREQSIGGVIKYIKLENLTDAILPLPTITIQKRIAEILDAADALRRKDQELLRKYDELAQAIFIDMFGDPVKNEKGWEVKKLKRITSKIGSGATPTGGKTAYKESGISLIRSMNVYDFSFKWKDLAFIDEVQAAKLNNVEVKSKDVLFNITGASVCRCSIVPDELLPARVNQHVAIIRAKENELNPVFLNHLLVSDKVKRNLLGIGAGGGAVMEAITKDQLENLEIILPPIEIQNKFEVNWSKIYKMIKNTKSLKSDLLFDSLLQQAFKGELVK